MLTVSDCLTCVEIVNQGLGHSLIPADLLPKCAPQVNKELIYDNQKHTLTRPSHLIYKQAMLQSTPVKIFVEYLRQHFNV